MKNADVTPFLTRLSPLTLALALPLAGCIEAGEPPPDDLPPIEEPSPTAPATAAPSAPADEAPGEAPLTDCHILPEGQRLCWTGVSVDVEATVAVPFLRDGDARALIADAALGLHWLRFTADGAIDLQAIAGLQLPAPATAGAIGDADGNGDRDVLLHTGDRGYWVHTVDADTVDGVSYGPPSPALAVLAGDVDGDGEDNHIVAITRYGVAALAVFVDNIVQEVLVPESPATGLMTTGDVDGDGVVDLLVATAEDTIGVFPIEISAAGLLLSATLPALPPGPILGLLTVDLDGDGDDELIVHQGPATCDDSGCDDVIRIYQATPGGLMPEAQTLRIGEGAGRPIVADVDGDGAPDLVVAHAGAPVLTALVGDGVGSFRDRFDISAPPAAIGARLSAADLSGDGKDELLLAGGTGSGLWIVAAKH